MLRRILAQEPKRYARRIVRLNDEPLETDETHYVSHRVEIVPNVEMIQGTANAFDIVLQAEQPPVIDEYTLNARIPRAPPAQHSG